MAKVRKIGSSYGVLIPKKLMKDERIKEGEEIELALFKNSRKELVKKTFGMWKGAKPFVREYEPDRV